MSAGARMRSPLSARGYAVTRPRLAVAARSAGGWCGGHDHAIAGAGIRGAVRASSAGNGVVIAVGRLTRSQPASISALSTARSEARGTDIESPDARRCSHRGSPREGVPSSGSPVGRAAPRRGAPFRPPERLGARLRRILLAASKVAATPGAPPPLHPGRGCTISCSARAALIRPAQSQLSMLAGSRSA